MKVCLQAGHINGQYNIDLSLRASTGAPGEQELTKRITDRVASILRDKGFEVRQTDACANGDETITKSDWDLFLAIHGDADYAGDKGGGFVDYPDPSVDDSNVESKRIKETIESEYFKHSEILNTPHPNANTKFYYMWKYLTAKTPCNLIELGQVQDPHDKVLLADTNRIAGAVARGVCKAFNVPYDQVTPPIDPCKSIKEELEDTKNKLSGLQKKYDLLVVEADNDHNLIVELKSVLKKLA